VTSVAACGREVRLRQQIALQRGGQHPRAERLGEHQHVARLGAAVPHDAVGMHFPDRDHAVLGLGVVHRMAAEHERTSGARHLGAAA